MGHSTFTVVVCSKDRRESLSRCLGSLATAFGDIEDKRWDVLVVDNASSDGTSDHVRSLIENYPVPLNVIREETLGLAIARNTGLREAQGDVAIFVDDDVTFFEGWISAWTDCFDDESVAAAGGPVVPVFPDAVPSWYREGLMADGGTTTGNYHHGDEVLTFEPGGAVGHPRGGNMAMRRMRALETGGFREDLGWGKKTIPGEETEFFKRLHAKNGRILYLPLACVNHHLDEERMNFTHLRAWHEGYGRASIMMKPPMDPLRWILKFVDQAFTFSYFSLRLVLPGGSRNFRAHRKQRQAVGRLTQMMGIGV